MDRKLIAVAVASALGLPMAADAVEGSVSGHVNRAVVLVDQEGNEKDGDAQHVDANSSETRFRFTGSEDLDNGLTAGIQLEIGKPSAWRTRHANAYLSGEFGKLTLGQQSTATDGMAHARLGGASWLGGVTNWCSYVSTGSDGTTLPACLTHDGARSEVLRYDTPALGGAVTLSGSAGNDEYWDAMLTAAGSMMGGGYDVRIGYIDTTETVAASGSVKLAMGTSVSAAWGQNDSDSEHQYVEVDHNYGDGSVGVYYRRGEDGDGTEGQMWGVGAGHSLGGGATAYVGFRTYDQDSHEDINLFVAGMRVTFN